ncbi:hypothetical protein AJ88_33120 [Mesorhizobium amorphae CCBAU 01583]|nr:hypothetical protein AJ88_33120 [Mesorhizobium amorphae CCBAU 01583]
MNFGEAELAFEWDIMDGSTVVRTLESAAGAVHYDDADVLSDFGGYPDELTFEVYMIGAFGRGYRARRHVVFNYTPTWDSTRVTFDSTVNTFDQEPKWDSKPSTLGLQEMTELAMTFAPAATRSTTTLPNFIRSSGSCL